MELNLPLISASLGATRSLAKKLDAFMDTELKDEIGKLGSRLQDLSKIRDPPLTARRWMKDVRELSYEMENCVDTETDWFLKISRFKARVKDFNGRYDRYALKEVLSHTKNIDPIVGRRLPTVGSDREPDLLVGLHGEGGAVDKLCHLLTDGDEHLKVLTIVGVGGIGKTTLAKELWRKHKPGDHFDCRAFVRMAKKPDMRRVLRSILAQVRPHQAPDANEVHDLIHHLNEHLQNKRYFIIIEDVWATSVWDIARHAFPKGHYSRIVRTTEVAQVALACRSYPSSYIFQMKPLSDSQAKELFTSAVFQSGEQYSPQFEGVIDEVVRICAGLPQAIISISSVLASQEEANTVENWEQIKNSLPTATTLDELLKEVLNFCYSCLPSCLQTCLLYLSVYPENYMILKEDIMKQWVAEGFILAPTENDKMEVAGRCFDKLVNMGLIQHIDVDYSEEVLYYVVHHMVHDYITSKSIEENFVTVMDYSQRTMRFCNKVSRLSLQFGSATHATSPVSNTTGMSQVRSLAFFGLMSCRPSIFEFKLLRSLTLHIWADQPRLGFDLKHISELPQLRYLQVTCNDIIHLPDQLPGLKYMKTLEINAPVAAIPADIFNLVSLLHLRLGGGTELPDVTGVLTNVNLNPSSAAILLDESSSPPVSVQTIEFLPPISRMPKWIGQLSNLCILKIMVRELQRNDISNLQGLRALTVLCLYIQRLTSTEPILFMTGSFAALEYFDFRCGVLSLAFEEGAMPNLRRFRLGFNVHRGGQYGCSLIGIEHLSKVQDISGIIGVATVDDKDDFGAAESAFREDIGKHCSNVSVKRVVMVDEDYGPTEKQRVIGEKDASTELPTIPEKESEEDIEKIAANTREIELPKDLPFDFLKNITDQFSEGLIIGTGAFGVTYKGTARDGETIAVQKLTQNSAILPRKAFTDEVQSIMSLYHENVLRLVGFCHESQKKLLQNNGRYIVVDVVESLLCYEYLPQGSLEKNLFEVSTRMDWNMRFNIIKGICNGVLFLHRIPIVHMDLKPENILLDSNMVPKIAEFGLSRIFGQEHTRINTQKVVGSYGYMAPEYLYKGEISTKSDIYSLGIIIIEATTGEKNFRHSEPSAAQFIKKIRDNWKEKRISSEYPSLKADSLQQVKLCIEIGLKCVEIDQEKRPSIQEILNKLNGRS